MSLGKTHKSRGWGGDNCVGAFVCVRWVHFLNARVVGMVAIEWNLGLFAI